MKASKKVLLALFIGLVIIKTLLSLSAVTLSIYSDEYIYLKLSESLSHGSYTVHGMPSRDYPPFYPFAISLANIANDTQNRYFLIKLINAILSTAIIIPAFLLLRKFVTEKKAAIGATLVALHPSSFSFTPYIMSENLFYLLFLITILFMFNAFKTQKVSWHLATGILISLSFLTRTMGLLLIPLYIIAQLIVIIKTEKKERSWKRPIINILITLLIAGLVMAPWILYNKSFDKDKPLGAYTNEASIPNIKFIPQILLWIFLYAAFITISTAMILPTAASTFWKKTKIRDESIMAALLLAAVVIFIVAGANHSIHSNIKSALLWILGRPMGRYIDTIAPIIIIAGYIQVMKREKKELQKPLMIAALISIIAMPILIYFNLGPVNNISLTFFEGIKRVIDGAAAQAPSLLTMSIVAFLIAAFSITVLILKDKKKLLLCIIAAFLLANAASYYGTYYNTKIWDNHPQIQMSKWINDHIPQDKIIGIDQQGCKPGNMKEDPTKLCHEEGHTSLIGVWINNPIRISKYLGKRDYLISTQELTLPLLHSEGPIHLYQRE